MQLFTNVLNPQLFLFIRRTMLHEPNNFYLLIQKY